MARYFFDGFDHGSMALWGTESGVLDSTSQITGAYSMKTNCIVTKEIVSSAYEMYFGCWFKESDSGSVWYLTLAPGNAAVSQTLFPTSYFEIYPTSIQFRVQGTLSFSQTITVGQLDYPINNLQVRFKNNQDLSILVQAKLNGELLLNTTFSANGYPYYISDRATAGFILDTVRIRVNSPSINYAGYVDDIVIADEWPGPSKVYTLMPDGIGSSTMWQPSDGNGYSCVDEVPSNTTDFVTTDGALDLDLYTLENLPTGVVTVRGVQVFALAKTPGSPAYEYLQAALRTGGGNYFSSSQKMLYNYETIFKFWETNPNTGNPWTGAEINAMEAGVRLVTS